MILGISILYYLLTLVQRSGFLETAVQSELICHSIHILLARHRPGRPVDLPLSPLISHILLTGAVSILKYDSISEFLTLICGVYVRTPRFLAWPITLSLSIQLLELGLVITMNSLKYQVQTFGELLITIETASCPWKMLERVLVTGLEV